MLVSYGYNLQIFIDVLKNVNMYNKRDDKDVFADNM